MFPTPPFLLQSQHQRSRWAKEPLWNAGIKPRHSDLSPRLRRGRPRVEIWGGGSKKERLKEEYGHESKGLHSHRECQHSWANIHVLPCMLTTQWLPPALLRSNGRNEKLLTAGRLTFPLFSFNTNSFYFQAVWIESLSRWLTVFLQRLTGSHQGLWNVPSALCFCIIKHRCSFGWWNASMQRCARLSFVNISSTGVNTRSRPIYGLVCWQSDTNRGNSGSSATECISAVTIR